ncbi:MAG: GAF domain-containing protein [Burkholderiaceae bacterium]
MISTFIKAAEVWVPSDDGQLLEFGNGTFGSARRFATITKSMCFGRGEGLPGRAWDGGRPILLNNLDDPYFRRATAARAAGLSCAVALPFFQRDKLTAVLVIFCSHGDAAAAMELWHNNAHIATDMTLVAGAYGPHGAAFESISHETSLPRGAGLPGQAWRRGEVIFMDDLSAEQHHFVRAEQVAAAGLKRGLAIPMESLHAADRHVITFLVGSDLPLAKRIERWVPNDTKSRLNCVYAYSEQHGATVLMDEIPLSLPLPTAGSVAAALTQGTPMINIHPAKESGAPGVTAGLIEATALIAIPVMWDGEVVEVVVLYI